MLIGRAVHNLDTKGRIVIPSKYREDFGTTVFAFIAPDGCVRLYPRASFEEVLEKLKQSDITMLDLRRCISGSAEAISLDVQGRVLLPENLREAAGITDKVRMVGMIDWLELWNEDSLGRVENKLTTEEQVDFMAKLGLA